MSSCVPSEAMLPQPIGNAPRPDHLFCPHYKVRLAGQLRPTPWIQEDPVQCRAELEVILQRIRRIRRRSRNGRLLRSAFPPLSSALPGSPAGRTALRPLAARGQGHRLLRLELAATPRPRSMELITTLTAAI